MSFLRGAAVLLLIFFCTAGAKAYFDSTSSEPVRFGLGDQFRESLLKIRVRHPNSMLSYRTLYCTEWQEMKKIIDVESAGKDSQETFSRLDSCDIQCLTFWPEKIRMRFTFHDGRRYLAVQALQTDLMSTVYVFLRPDKGVRKIAPYVQINTAGSVASAALAPPSTCN